MQKSKKIGFIIIVFIIILIAMLLVFVLNNNKKDLTMLFYNDINKSQEYTITIEGEDEGYKYIVTRAQSITDVCIDMISKYEDEEQHTTTLVTDRNAYYIMHNEQEYNTLDSEDIEANVLMPEIENIEGKVYQKGEETIRGKKYYYEEYEGIETFLILVDIDEEAELKTRFYYDKGKIVYIRNIIKIDGEIFEELLKIKCIYDTEDSLFEIPEDYAEVSE